MKLQARAIDAFLKRPDPTVRMALIFGPDTGLARERAEALARQICPDLNDPFRVAELRLSDITADPTRLVDEVAAIPFTGGRRLVRIRDGDEGLTTAITRFLESPPAGDGFLIIEAGDLATRSKLRTAVEGSSIGAALPCYVEDEGSLAEVIQDMARHLGLRLDFDSIEYLAGQLIGDRRVARGEVEKLALYAGDQKHLSLDEVRACVGDSASLDASAAVMATADGDFTALDRALRRLFDEGTTTVAILRAAQRHFSRLATAAARHQNGASIDQAIAALKPPVFYKEKIRFTNQARRWTGQNLRMAMARLIEAEADVKRSHMPDQTICARVLFQLASMARR